MQVITPVVLVSHAHISILSVSCCLVLSTLPPASFFLSYVLNMILPRCCFIFLSLSLLSPCPQLPALLLPLEGRLPQRFPRPCRASRAHVGLRLTTSRSDTCISSRSPHTEELQARIVYHRDGDAISSMPEYTAVQCSYRIRYHIIRVCSIRIRYDISHTQGKARQGKAHEIQEEQPQSRAEYTESSTGYPRVLQYTIIRSYGYYIIGYLTR